MGWQTNGLTELRRPKAYSKHDIYVDYLLMGIALGLALLWLAL